MKRPAIFLDRDGTLIEEVNYLSRSEDLRLFRYTKGAVEMLKAAGYLVVVVTNQSGIGRGIYTESDMHAIHESIQVQLDHAIDAFYFCPHLPCDGCVCRKPRTGMIEAAVRDLDIDLQRSWMVGDKDADVNCGKNARIKTVLVLTGYGSSHRGMLDHPPDLIANDLGEAAAIISAA
ncbi:MAG: HAD family hydrolase [Chloracidobacterium sp.]|nr:HAD family hydrolase [Chloracidobacterium sp.]